MATQPPHAANRQAGHDWLLSCTDQPDAAQDAWDADDFAPFETGPHWRAAEANLAQSMEAINELGTERLGPVLADIATGVAWWLLPPDLGDELDDIRLLTVHPHGWVLRCPPVLFWVRSRVWVVRPDGSGRLTDPVLLGAAFGPGGGFRPLAEAFG